MYEHSSLSLNLCTSACKDKQCKDCASTEPSRFRPVALTSHLMKTMERIVLTHLQTCWTVRWTPCSARVDLALVWKTLSSTCCTGHVHMWEYCESRVFWFLHFSFTLDSNCLPRPDVLQQYSHCWMTVSGGWAGVLGGNHQVCHLVQTKPPGHHRHWDRGGSDWL